MLSEKVFGALVVFIFISDPFIEVGEKSFLRCNWEISLQHFFYVNLKITHPTLSRVIYNKFLLIEFFAELDHILL